jgi:hypothetical protein
LTALLVALVALILVESVSHHRGIPAHKLMGVVVPRE